ncbi:MAG: hypothetical protein AUJ49_00840 [Desulfovibrionaceae bacterium CG1_02_65_16]|nr:MAG: hypothetical protein AUJ49_00840 [Desulfovibrionaceae bacterium CG1_02_65_16]
MPPRSLRRGDKQPNPGAVHKGCPRPKALRFDSPLGTPSAFGDSSYSGNILQGGFPLSPQDYLLDGVTPMPRCIVITNTATVVPDAYTGAAVWMAHNVALIGASASLSAAANCKGMLGFVSGLTALREGAHLHMDKLGKAGAFGDLSPDMLLPARLRRRISCGQLKSYRVKGEGAEGGAGVYDNSIYGSHGRTPAPAGPMQTGGGGSGACSHGTSGHAGKGGPCCGGAGSGGVDAATGPNAGDFGGPGGDGKSGNGYPVCGGGGDPVGVGAGNSTYARPGQGAGGGLLGLFTRHIDIAASCVVSADGAAGGAIAGTTACGGSTGGGCVFIVTIPGGYTIRGTVRAAGGTTGASAPGGVGSVNIFELAA